MAAKRSYKSGSFAQGGNVGYGQQPTPYTQGFQAPNPDMNVPTMIPEDQPRIFHLECYEKKGKIGKLTVYENTGNGDKKPSERAPKFKGQIRIGDTIFDVNLWADKVTAGCFSGPIQRSNC